MIHACTCKRTRLEPNLKLHAAVVVAITLLALVLLHFSTASGRHSCPPTAAHTTSDGNLTSSVSSDHELFSQVQRDLQDFNESGITLQQVEHAYCRGSRASMRVQVVDGRAYIAGETAAWESRMFRLKTQILDLWLAGGMPEGIDFVIEAEDGPTVGWINEDCPSRGPVLGAAKNPADPEHSHVVLAPDHTFAGWPEAHTLPWNEMLPLLHHAGELQPWEQRSDLLFFRGGATGLRFLLAPDLSSTHPDQLDVQLVDWSTSGFVTLPDHCRYKYLLQLPGATYSAKGGFPSLLCLASMPEVQVCRCCGPCLRARHVILAPSDVGVDSGRLKYLLACGSTVVVSDGPWAEFWSHLARPGEHFLLTDEVSGDNRGTHFANATATLQQDQGLAQRLGDAGQKLVQESLSPRMVQAYWRHLMHSYRSLQEYNATLHPDALPLEQSILLPWVIGGWERTCNLCKP
ncbi:O-glucosyltransferase rumi [Chlorella vulgaris]